VSASPAARGLLGVPPSRDHVRLDRSGQHIDSADLDLGNADLGSVKIGRFFARHPHYRDEPGPGTCGREHDVLRELETGTRGAHLVGAVPSFDADVLGARMRANGICPPWHYHL